MSKHFENITEFAGQHEALKHLVQVFDEVVKVEELMEKPGDLKKLKLLEFTLLLVGMKNIIYQAQQELLKIVSPDFLTILQITGTSGGNFSIISTTHYYLEKLLEKINALEQPQDISKQA